jgi:hypothetical protein
VWPFTCFNLLVRRLSGVLVLLPLVALIGHAQAPSVPTGDGHISGRILTSMSQPIADATVLLGLNDTGVPSESTGWWVATSDQQGLYEFSDRRASADGRGAAVSPPRTRDGDIENVIGPR